MHQPSPSGRPIPEPDGAALAQVGPVVLDDRPVGDAVVQLLGGRIVVEAAALGQNDACSRLDETVGHGDAGRPGADDEDVGAELSRSGAPRSAGCAMVALGGTRRSRCRSDRWPAASPSPGGPRSSQLDQPRPTAGQCLPHVPENAFGPDREHLQAAVPILEHHGVARDRRAELLPLRPAETGVELPHVPEEAVGPDPEHLQRPRQFWNTAGSPMIVDPSSSCQGAHPP